MRRLSIASGLIAVVAALAAGSAAGAAPDGPFITGNSVPGGTIVGHPGKPADGATADGFGSWFICPVDITFDCIETDFRGAEGAVVLHLSDSRQPGERIEYFAHYTDGLYRLVWITVTSQ